ncbi:MAG: class I SAM-dependent methyltransferase [bacterium]
MRFDFDQIEKGYEQELNRALAFSGKGADFFAEVRASLLISLCEENIGDPKQMSVLDVGSGIGLLERHIAGRFGRIHGVDVSLETVRQARLENDRCRFDVYDGEHLPFQDDSFDIVFSSCVLEYLPPEKVFQFFGEMRRVLKAGGLLVVIQHNPLNPLTRWVLHRCSFDDVMSQYRKGALEAKIRSCGLMLTKSFFILFFPFQGRLFRRLERWLGWLPIGAQYLIAAKK